MALDPHSEKPVLGSTEDYSHDHPDENPEDWGWHGEWGRGARLGGIVMAAILLLLITTTHYNNQGTMWLAIFALAIIVALAWDIQRRKHSWRK